MHMQSLKEGLELRHAELPHSQAYFLMNPLISMMKYGSTQFQK